MVCKSEPEFQISDIPSLDGYVAIVTGGNSGVGYETSLQLAKKGARVYIAGRSAERVAKAIDDMRQGGEKLDLHFLKLDLQDLQSIKHTVEEFLSKEPKLDILINNAGIMACPYDLTKDGHEVQWQTCFLAHHALTLSLMPALINAADISGAKDRVRVVNVASDAVFVWAPKNINYEDPNLTDVTGTSAGWRRYGHCKQASIIAAKAINDRYQSRGVTAYSLHPGLIATGLQSQDPTIIGTVTRFAFKYGPTLSPLDGSRNSLYCATSKDAFAHAGRYHVPFGKVADKADKWLDDQECVDKLWDLADKQLKGHGFVFAQ